MNKIGGQYLHPITFLSDSYNKGDFNNKDFWKKEQKSWGKIVLQYDHTSYPNILPYNTTGLSSRIFISKDGLIASELPENITSDDEALTLLSHHINSFLGLINLGGKFFFPFSEKEISHIELKDSSLSQISGGGDAHSQTDLKRAICRYQIPLVAGTSIIDFPWIMMRIEKIAKINAALKLGKRIIDSPYFKKDSQILVLEAYKEYTLSKWNNSLLLSWTFIEILLDELWKKEFLEKVTTEEVGRKKRLKDNRIYSSAIKIEIFYTKSIVDVDTYVKLNRLRTFRNDFIHEGKFITKSDVNIFFEVINKIVKILTGSKPLFNNPSWTRSGGWTEK